MILYLENDEVLPISIDQIPKIEMYLKYHMTWREDKSVWVQSFLYDHGVDIDVFTWFLEHFPHVDNNFCKYIEGTQKQQNVIQEILTWLFFGGTKDYVTVVDCNLDNVTILEPLKTLWNLVFVLEGSFVIERKGNTNYYIRVKRLDTENTRTYVLDDVLRQLCNNLDIGKTRKLCIK